MFLLIFTPKGFFCVREIKLNLLQVIFSEVNHLHEGIVIWQLKCKLGNDKKHTSFPSRASSEK